MEKKNLQYISLQKATEYCSYSQEYLSLLARNGKLKSVKFGRNWVTTKEWIEEYAERIKTSNNRNNQQEEKLVSVTSTEQFSPASTTKEPNKELSEVTEEAENQESEPEIKKSSFNFLPPKIISEEKIPLAALIAVFFVLLVSGGVFAIRQGDNELAEWVGKESSKNVFQKTNPYVIGLNQELDKGIVQGWKGVTTAVQAIGQAGDSIVVGVTTSFKESFAQVSQDVFQFSDDFSQFSGEAKSTVGKVTSFGAAGLNQLADVSQEIPKSIAEIFQDLSQGLARQVSNIQGGLGGVTRTIVQGFKITGQGIFYGFEGIGKGMAGIGKGVTEGGKSISEVGAGLGTAVLQGTSNGLEWLAEGVKGIGQGITEGIRGIAQGAKNIVSNLIKGISSLVIRPREKIPEEPVVPKPAKEGLAVIPSTEEDEDEEVKKKIKKAFSDEVKVEPKDETSGIITPIFREREGEKYLYILVPLRY